MPRILRVEQQHLLTTQDPARLKELKNHELLRGSENAQIASFDQVKEIGRWFLGTTFNRLLPSTQPVPDELLVKGLLPGTTFLAKLMLGTTSGDHFPVTAQVVRATNGFDVRLHIVPINFQSLEVSSVSNHNDSLLALAAAAAVAPQFVIALEGGIQKSTCDTKATAITSITPDHGSPLAVVFDAFNGKNTTLDAASRITSRPDLTIKQAAHLHGHSATQIQSVSTAAAGSTVAAGVPIQTLLRSELPAHVLAFPSVTDPKTGQVRIQTLQEVLASSHVATVDLSMVAAALGFTARVVGDSQREKTIERILSPQNAEAPLVSLIRA